MWGGCDLGLAYPSKRAIMTRSSEEVGLIRLRYLRSVANRSEVSRFSG